MDLQGCQSAWQSLLPQGVHGCAGFEALPLDRLSLAERQSIAGAGEQRLHEFQVGRWQARRALAAMGVDASEIPRRADGAPAWPAGVVGSLAHTVCQGRSFAFAVVADEKLYAGLGVDVEAPGRIEPRLWPTIFRPSELDALLRLPMPSRSLAASLRWSAKEAVFKAGGHPVDLREITVALDDDTGRFFVAAPAGARADCEGRVLAAAGGWVFALARRRAR